MRRRTGRRTNGDDTRHDDGDDTLHHEVRAEDGHGGDTNASLGRAVAGRTRAVSFPRTDGARGAAYEAPMPARA
jgi:hypothetical protein